MTDPKHLHQYSDKYLSVERIFLKHQDDVHEFKTYSSPFVCKVCPTGSTCSRFDGASEEPIDLSLYNKFEKQYKYESTHFYGEGYCMDIVTIEVRLINSYSFTVLISRESPFSEMPLDFHEIISSTPLTPKFLHEKLLERVITTVKNVEPVQKLLEVKRTDDHPKNQGPKYPPVGIY